MQASTPAAGRPVFTPTVESRHVRIDADAYDDIYVVGDVHGCIRELEQLVSSVGADEGTLFVFVGDLVRKGPDSSAVLARVREHENMVTVRGNNEQKLIDGRADCDGLSDCDREYIESLPVAVSWDDTLVVHGGVDPRVSLAEHTAEDLLTMRRLPRVDQQPYWFTQHRGPPQVFFGHTVLEAPFETPWAVGLDTGCVYGGQLTAYHYDTGEYVTLDARRAHQFREPDKFLAPRQVPGSGQSSIGSSNPVE
jgi:serine/threonine protein phosphatase 1